MDTTFAAWKGRLCSSARPSNSMKSLFGRGLWVGLLGAVLAGLAHAPAAAQTQVDTVTVTVSFAAPGDDGFVGRATAYDIRYSTQLITLANWDQATRVKELLPSPRAAGSQESILVSIPGAVQGLTYYFALRTRDEVYHWSALSNNAAHTHAEQVAPETILRVK